MVSPTELTVKPQDADASMVILTSTVHKFERVRIYQRHRRWHWQHVYADGKLAQSSTKSFGSALEAALAGAIVAHCEGIPTVLPRELKTELEPQIAAIWRKEGADKFHVGMDIDECWNVHQRQGFAAALLSADEITLMERDLAGMRRGKQRITVRLSDEDLAAAERELAMTNWRD